MPIPMYVINNSPTTSESANEHCLFHPDHPACANHEHLTTNTTTQDQHCEGEERVAGPGRRLSRYCFHGGKLAA